jgi:glycosyltransferase involved in cell wall biosynthesis
LAKKIAFFISHPIQYYSPLFRKLSDNTDIDLMVYYFSDETLRKFTDRQFNTEIEWDTDLVGGYDFKVLKNNSPYKTIYKHPFGLINFQIISELRRNQYDYVIVHGWSYISQWIVFISAFFMRVPVLLRGEMPLNQEKNKNRFKLLIKKLILKPLFKKIHGFLYIGSQNKEFFLSYGVDDSKLYFAPYAVDNDFFSSRYQGLKGSKNELKEKYNLAGYSKVVIFVGKLIEKKRPLDLVRAFQALNRPDYCLVFVGDGNLRGEIEHLIATDSDKNIFVTGFLNQSKLPELYVLGDLFVLPSGVGETWGLVVNEAMNYKLPVLVSNTVGCSFDLVSKNGMTFAEGDIVDLTAKLKLLLEDPNLKVKGDVSLEIIKNYSYENIEKAVANAIKIGDHLC